VDRRDLILLDRDGVLNRMVFDPEHGTADSPLHPSQVEVVPGVATALARLTDAGFGLAIVTNQPAAAKGKTTFENLAAVNARVVEEISREGGRILSSHLCLHRAEEGCGCRKPAPGLLEQALAANPGFGRASAWMIGDGITDVQAGKALGLRTVYVGRKFCAACEALEETCGPPTAWAADLVGFVRELESKGWSW
jgi:D-glycero-D-manno-heptose 1,7-bisphosphate phosphatase